jgi:outer membrane protein TolC
VRYETGVDPYLNVLTAQTTLLSNQQMAATLHITEMVAAIGLIEALGGGWDLSQMPSSSQITHPMPGAKFKIDR